MNYDDMIFSIANTGLSSHQYFLYVIKKISGTILAQFSLKGKEIKRFKSSIDEVYKLLGKKYFYRSKSEDSNKVFRRSIFVVKNILKGEKFTKYNIRRIRPGYGVSPVYYEKILNKKSPSNLKKGNPLNLNILKKIKII